MREPESAFENFGEHFSHVELLDNASELQITKNHREPVRTLDISRQPWSCGAHRCEPQRTFANFGDMANSGEPL